MGEATISAETPTTTSVVWISVPHSAPAIEAKPAARPWLSVRDTNSVMSGPGVIARITVAMANWTSVVVSGMKDMGGPDKEGELCAGPPGARQTASASIGNTLGEGAASGPAAAGERRPV